MWNLRTDISDLIEENRGQRKYPPAEMRKKLSEKLLSDLLSSSHRFITYTSESSLLTFFSWNLESDIWESIGAHGEKGNIVT